MHPPVRFIYNIYVTPMVAIAVTVVVVVIIGVIPPNGPTTRCLTSFPSMSK